MVSSYAGVVVNRQTRGSFHLVNIPLLISRVGVFTTFYLYITNISLISNEQSQSLYCNTKNFFLIYTTKNIKHIDGKYKDCKL